MCVCFGFGCGEGGGGGEEVVAGYLSILSMSQIETIPKLVTSYMYYSHDTYKIS